VTSTTAIAVRSEASAGVAGDAGDKERYGKSMVRVVRRNVPQT
jgi:hypothetical protein